MTLYALYILVCKPASVTQKAYVSSKKQPLEGFCHEYVVKRKPSHGCCPTIAKEGEELVRFLFILFSNRRTYDSAHL